MDKNNLLEEERIKALEQFEEWHTNKAFQVEDKEFKRSQMNHEGRLKTYALYSQIETNMILSNYGFLEDAKFKALFKEVENKVLFDDMLISKIPNFWEDNEDIYLSFIQTSLKLICYPLKRQKKKAIN